MAEALQVIGALLVLAGFAGTQVVWLSQKSVTYLLINAIGAGILAVLAFLEEQWGFLLLEGVWTIVAVVGLIRTIAGPRTPTGARSTQLAGTGSR